MLWATLLLVVSLLLLPLGIAGKAYGAVALISGTAYLGYAAHGLLRQRGRRWARRLMLGSVLHLTVLFVALVLDAA